MVIYNFNKFGYDLICMLCDFKMFLHMLLIRSYDAYIVEKIFYELT